MKFRTWHWALALTGAVALHSAVVVAALWKAPDPGAQAVGAAGIEIALGAAGGAPGGAQTVQPSEAQQQKPEEVKAEEVPPAPAEPPQEVVPAETVPVEVASVPDVVPVEEVKPVEEKKPEEVTVREVIRKPVPKPQKKPVPPRPVPPPAVEPVRQVEPEAAPAAQPAQTAAVDTQTTRDRAVAPSVAGAGGKAGTQDSRGAGNHSDRSGGGSPGAPPDYISRLRAWLDRHKEYPRPARMRREEGTAYLYFVIARDGRVLQFDLRKSSGFGSLDRATIDMIKRASPVPEIPESMSVAKLELVIPVQFQLR